MTADEQIDTAKTLGGEHGKRVGAFYFDKDTSRAEYERVSQGIADGDDEVLAELPTDPLSGEFADEPTPQTVFAALGMSGNEDHADDVLQAYEDSFHMAVQGEIEATVRAALAASAEITIEIDEMALTAAHVAVEDELTDRRDRRIGLIGPANGFVVREADGAVSDIIRLGTRDGLRLAITAYLSAVRSKEGAVT
jgi:hypothetical protein